METPGAFWVNSLATDDRMNDTKEQLPNWYAGVSKKFFPSAFSEVRFPFFAPTGCPAKSVPKPTALHHVSS
jgi:hypothetical protein